MDMTVNERIASYRRLANLSQNKVAELMEMKHSTYSQMERSGSITTDRLVKLAKILDVDVNDILYGPETKKHNAEPLVIIPPEQEINRLEEPVVNPFGTRENELDTLTSMERNMIKMYKNFKKSDQERVRKFIESIYREQKSK